MDGFYFLSQDLDIESNTDIELHECWDITSHSGDWYLGNDDVMLIYKNKKYKSISYNSKKNILIFTSENDIISYWNIELRQTELSNRLPQKNPREEGKEPTKKNQSNSII